MRAGLAKDTLAAMTALDASIERHDTTALCC
jgi:hypothetical protein